MTTDQPEKPWAVIECKHSIDIAFIGTRHSLGNTNCWCNPNVDWCGEKIMVTHSIRAHRWRDHPSGCYRCEYCGAYQTGANADSLCKGPAFIGTTKVPKAEDNP